MIWKILYVYSTKCFDDDAGEKGAPFKWTSQECHRVVLPWAPRGDSKVDPVRSPDKLVPEDYWVAKVEGADAYRGIWVMLWRQCNSMSLRSTVGTIAEIVWRMSVNGLHLILPGRQRNIGRLRSMVKWSGEVSFFWQRNSRALMPTVIWVFAVIAT